MDEAHKELVKRLKRTVYRSDWDDTIVYANPDGKDAIDALEAMAGERDAWEKAAREHMDWRERNRERANAAESERDRLKAALVRLGSVEAFTSSQGICPELYERITYARKALGDAS